MAFKLFHSAQSPRQPLTRNVKQVIDRLVEPLNPDRSVQVRAPGWLSKRDITLSEAVDRLREGRPVAIRPRGFQTDANGLRIDGGFPMAEFQTIRTLEQLESWWKFTGKPNMEDQALSMRGLFKNY